MSRKHKPKHEPYQKTARDSRKAVHKYYPVDDTHRHAVPAGRCYKCKKITDAFCDSCNAWACKNHLEKTKTDLEVCENCAGSED